MSYSVLLVDNENVITKGLMHLIDWENNNCEVIATAQDGMDAIRKIEERMPDIIITDIRMPEMDGLQLCQWVRRNELDIQIILLTGFPDFEYAQQAIKYQVVDFVLKPTSEEALVRALDKAVNQIEKKIIKESDGNRLALEQKMFLSELIYGNRHSLLYMMDRMKKLNMNLLHYHVVSMRVSTTKTIEHLPALLKEAEQVFSECCQLSFYIVPKNDGTSYIVIDEREQDRVEAICQKTSDRVDEETDFVVAMGISRFHRDMLEMPIACKEADDAQRLARYSSQPSVMHSDDLPQLSEEAAQSILAALRLVETSLESNSRESTMQNYALFLEAMKRVNLPFSKACQIAKLLEGFCTRLLLSYDNLQSVERQPLRFETFEDIELGLQELLNDTLITLHRSPENIDRVIYDIKQHIDNNYAENLSLDALAGLVHLSPSYFSKLFKREMGENLSTYITNVRIEHAKFLLKTTDKKTYEIAEAVGIDDPVYFSKIFKKITGMKPKEFKNADNM